MDITGPRRRASEHPRASVARRQTSNVGSGRRREEGREEGREEAGAGGRGLTFELRERRSRREGGTGKKRRLAQPRGGFCGASVDGKKGSVVGRPLVEEIKRIGGIGADHS